MGYNTFELYLMKYVAMSVIMGRMKFGRGIPKTYKLLRLTYTSLITLTLFIVILISISTGILVAHYQSYNNFVQTQMQEISKISGQNALLLLHNIEALIRTTRTQIVLGVTHRQLHDFLEQTTGDTPQLRTLLYIDKEGIVQADSRPDEPAKGLYAGDRTYFRVHKNQYTDNIFIDDPVQSRVDGEWSLPITMGIWQDDEFMGIIAASLEPTYFDEALNIYLVNQPFNGIGYFVNARGTILTTIPYNEMIINQQISLDTILSENNLNSKNQLFNGSGNLTNELSLMSITTIHEDDLWVIFEQPWSDILSPFYVDVVITLFILLIAIIFSYIILRWQSQQSLKIIGQSNRIRQEHNLLRTLIDNIPGYIYIKDNQGNILTKNSTSFANPKTLELEQETIKQLHATDDDILQSGQGVLDQETVITNSTGDQRWISASKVPLFHEEDHTVTGLIGILRDVTDQRQAQEEKLQTTLMRRQIEREREQIELRQQFISRASHDFRTPLTIMKTSVSLLQGYGDRLSPEKRDKKLNDIDRQIDHMVNLLDDVLLVSRANAGKVPFNPTSILLEPFCRDIWQDVLEVDHKQHKTQYMYEATVDTLHADQNLLHSALINLLSNAFKYTPQDGLIKFEIHSDEVSITFTIEDSGSGIPESDQSHLFTPFYRATNTRDIEGTGLGLVIAKSYVELHNGTLTFESVENQGTTFTVKIPIN